jgi:uncharacterized protein (TIGR02145 family)
MKQFSAFALVATLCCCMIFIQGCKKKSNDSSTATGRVPVVQTTNYSNVLLTTIDFTGNVTDDAGSFVTRRGFCYSATSVNPTLLDSWKEGGTGAGGFSATLTGMLGQTTYHVRAFATNSNGTGYGSSFAVTTIDSTLVDASSFAYGLVQIGEQVWISRNFRTAFYNNGVPVNEWSNPFVWDTLVTPALAYYNNDALTAPTYGCFYNWYAVNQARLVPDGWHIPSNDEWITLINNLGGYNDAGGKLKSTGTLEDGTGLWTSPNTGATNSSGFSARPAGDRFSNGSFYDRGSYGIFWTSTASNTDEALCVTLYYGNAGVIISKSQKTCGYSVRLVRD